MSVRKERGCDADTKKEVCGVGTWVASLAGVLGQGKKEQCRGSGSSRPEIEKIWACAHPRTRARMEAGTAEWPMMLCRVAEAFLLACALHREVVE
jgi:hypothetical protein